MSKWLWLSLVLWNTAWAQSWPGERVRLELELRNDAGWPEQTAVKLRFDHAAEVDAGRSRADGADVTLLLRAPDGGVQPRHRVLEPASEWNRADTELWFNVGEANDAGELTGAFSLSLGGTPAGLEDGAEVFLFFADFEDGGVDDWTVIRNTMASPLQAADAGAHRGRFALQNRPAGAGVFQAIAPLTRALPQDVVLESWVYLDDPPASQWAWFVRFDPVSDDSYNFGPDAAAGSWKPGQRAAGVYSRYAGSIPFTASPARQWLRTQVTVQGQLLSACVDSTCLGPVMGTTLFLDAGIGFGRVLTSADSDGGRRLLIDDVSVRPFVSPEPVVQIVQRLSGEGEPCTLDSECVSARCELTCQPPDAGAPDAGTPDAGTPDAGTPDAGTPDAGTPDAGEVDAGVPDAGAPEDAGVDPVPGDYLVGCACTTVDGAALWAALLLLASWRKARR